MEVTNIRSGACLVCQHLLLFCSRRPSYDTLEHLKGIRMSPVGYKTGQLASSGPLFGPTRSGKFDEILRTISPLYLLELAYLTALRRSGLYGYAVLRPCV